jgi:hypothetical protein
MRFIIGGVLIVGLLVSVGRGEQVAMELEWGFGPAGAEMYWDAQVQVVDGRLVSMKAVSFEPDRHDRIRRPKFQSFTVGAGTDGMELVVDGNDRSVVRMEGKQGTFEWKLGDLQKKLEVSFPSQEKGRLDVRLLKSLGDMPLLLSDKSTQDGRPAACRLADGRQLILWRAFLGTPSDELPGGGDQIRGRIVARDGKPGEVFDVLPAAGDVGAIGVVETADGNCRIVWAEQRQANWDIYTCSAKASSEGLEPGEPERLTTDPGVDKSPALAVTADGSLALVWQAWRKDRSGIFFQRCKDGRWSEPEVVAEGPANDWNPAIAATGDGSLAVSWSRWQNGSYDVCLRVWDVNHWSPVRVIAGTDRFEAHPNLVYDDQRTLWIAYEEGRAGWGMDSNTAGLRSERNVRLCCYRDRRVGTPGGSAALTLPEKLANCSEMAHLAVDGQGVVWLFARCSNKRGVWEVYGTRLGDEGWATPQKLRSSAAGQNIRMAAATDAEGRLRVVWVSDHRVNQVGKESYLYSALMPSGSRRSQPCELVERTPVDAKTEQADQPGPRPEYEFGGKTLGLYYGDLHRHTELSVCRTGGDGSLEDGYRYAIDAANLDFLCLTDHVQHVKILNDFDFWRSAKQADLHRVPGVHQPFYGYERSQRFPYGHRNIISPVRNVKRVPRTADNRPWSANSGYEGEERLAPPELWKRMVGENVITIPHSSTSPVMGTDFAHAPAEMEPVVEIYQGCRYTSEHAGAPDPRAVRDSDVYSGKTQPEGFIWNALSKGHRYGFIASSDHSATHNSYTCIWAEDFSNQSILDALAKRQCYAATDRIECRMSMGPHLMGSEFTAREVPPLEVEVLGRIGIKRVDIIKDNQVVFVREPKETTRRVKFQFQDREVRPGVHYYYARVIQEDRNMAWVSPIWVKVEADE